MEKVIDLKDLLKHEIMDLYSAEEQIIEALPLMIDKAGNDKLKAALQEHLDVTQNQKVRLDEIKQLLAEAEVDGNSKGGEAEASSGEEASNEKENGENGEEENGEEKDDKEKSEEKKPGFFSRLFGGEEKCKGMEGLINEGKKMMSADMSPEASDAAIIASAQKIEHYEISGYGTARAFARELNLGEIANKLEQTLNEEYKADDVLTELAVGKINAEAEAAGETDDADEKAAQSRSNGQSTSSKNKRSQTNLLPAKKAAPKKSLSKSSPSKAPSKPSPSKSPVSKSAAAKVSKPPVKSNFSGGRNNKAAAKLKTPVKKTSVKKTPVKKTAAKSKGTSNSRAAVKSKTPVKKAATKSKGAAKKSITKPAKKTISKSSSKSRSLRGR